MVMPRVRQVRVAPSRAQRQRERRVVGRLRDGIIQERTRQRYFAAIERFVRFLRCQFSFPTSFEQLDHIAAAYVEACWEDGEPKSFAADCPSALGHYLPAVKKHLGGSWRLIAAWSRLEMPERAPPLTLCFTYAIGAYFKERLWTDSLVLLLLGFHTFARSGELFGARCRDFVLRDDGVAAVWTLPLSKSGQREGIQEVLSVDDPWLVGLLKLYLATLAPSQHLSKVSDSVQRDRLWEATAALRIDHGYRWYSLRRGGATHFHQVKQDYGSLALKGRWGSLKTVRIYIQDAQAKLASLQVSGAQRVRLVQRALSLRPGLQLAC